MIGLMKSRHAEDDGSAGSRTARRDELKQNGIDAKNLEPAIAVVDERWTIRITAARRRFDVVSQLAKAFSSASRATKTR